MELRELAAKEQDLETIFKDLERRWLEEQDLEATAGLVLWATEQDLADELDLASLEEDVAQRVCTLRCGPTLG